MPTLSCGVRTRATLCLALLGSVACGHNAPGSARHLGNGYIVLGDRVRSRFGLVPGDTIPEMPRNSVHGPVQLAADSQALRDGFDVRCARYFRKDVAYVVLFTRGCASESATEDGDGMAAFDSTGTLLGPPAGPLWGYYTALRPAHRPPNQ
jgi:hypothetical protein